MQSQRLFLLSSFFASSVALVGCGQNADRGGTYQDTNEAIGEEPGGSDGNGSDGDGLDGDDGDSPDGDDGDGVEDSPGDAGAPAGEGADPLANDAGVRIVSPPTYYRADSLSLLSPPIFGRFLGLPRDITALANAVFEASVTTDIFPTFNPDGFVDASVFLRFDDPTASRGSSAVGSALCAAPLDDTACTADPQGPFGELTFRTKVLGTCLSSAGEQVDAPCFVTKKQDVAIRLGWLGVIPLQQVEIAGRFTNGDPPEAVEHGLLRGFLSETAANAARLPQDLPLRLRGTGILPGGRLSSVLAVQDQVTLGSETGWWLTARSSAVVHGFAE